jgi:hypothetical protein
LGVFAFNAAGCYRSRAEQNRARAAQIGKSVDLKSLHEWAAQQTLRSTQAVTWKFTDSIPGGPPKALEQIPRYGMIGPTIDLEPGPHGKDWRLGVSYFDSWGDAFELLFVDSENRLPTNRWRLQLRPGVYYVDRSHAALSHDDHPDK